jgi:hypothetical protein
VTFLTSDVFDSAPKKPAQLIYRGVWYGVSHAVSHVVFKGVSKTGAGCPPCRRQLLKRPYSRLRSGRLQDVIALVGHGPPHQYCGVIVGHPWPPPSIRPCTAMQPSMGVWQGVAIDSLKFHPDWPCQTLLCPAGRPAQRAGGLQLSSTLLETQRRTSMQPSPSPAGRKSSPPWCPAQRGGKCRLVLAGRSGRL